MILRSILEAIGLHATSTPTLHNQAVHDALNIKTAALAGHARMMRLQKAAEAARSVGDMAQVALLTGKQDDVRAGLDELARRLD